MATRSPTAADRPTWSSTWGCRVDTVVRSAAADSRRVESNELATNGANCILLARDKDALERIVASLPIYEEDNNITTGSLTSAGRRR